VIHFIFPDSGKTNVMANLPTPRYAYNKRLREKPGIKGKITVKYAIDELGTTVSCILVSSTVNDSKLEQIVLEIIKTWKFEKIDKSGDVTEEVFF
jgi:TonB family protein